MSEFSCRSVAEYTFYSNNVKQLREFQTFLEKLQFECNTGKVSVSVDSTKRIIRNASYYLIQREAGIPENEISVGKGYVVGIGQITNKGFNLWMDTAWCSFPDGMDKVLRKRFPDVKFAYIEEDATFDIYHIHDPQHRCYTHKYLVTGNFSGESGSFCYRMKSERNVVYAVSLELKRAYIYSLPDDCCDIKAAEQIVADMIASGKLSSNSYLSIHKYSEI